MTRMLLLPFCSEGYDENLMKRELRAYAEALSTCGFSVTAASPVGTYEEAEEIQRTTAPYAYDLCALFPVTWSEPRLAAVAARAFFDRPLLVLADNEFLLNGKRTEFSSAPAAAALYGCLNEMGVPAVFLPGPVKTHEAKLRSIARAASALSALRTARIGSVGENFNGITAGGLDLSVLRKRLGTEVYSFDGSTLIRKAEALPAESEAYRRAEAEVRAAYRGIPEEYEERIVRVTAALEELVREYGLSGLQVRCHTEFSQEYGLSMCLPLGIIGNQVAAACEADLPVLLTELLFRYLSSGKTPTYVDLRTFTEEGMDVGACGFAPTALTGSTGLVGGSNGYLTNTSDLKEGVLTIGRLLKKPGGRWVIHADSGAASGIEKRLTEFGCAPYPMTHIRPDHGMEWFRKSTGANHYALVYEDLTEELAAFSFFSGIGMV